MPRAGYWWFNLVRSVVERVVVALGHGLNGLISGLGTLLHSLQMLLQGFAACALGRELVILHQSGVAGIELVSSLARKSRAIDGIDGRSDALGALVHYSYFVTGIQMVHKIRSYM